MGENLPLVIDTYLVAVYGHIFHKDKFVDRAVVCDWFAYALILDRLPYRLSRIKNS